MASVQCRPVIHTALKENPIAAGVPQFAISSPSLVLVFPVSDVVDSAFSSSKSTAASFQEIFPSDRREVTFRELLRIPRRHAVSVLLGETKPSFE